MRTRRAAALFSLLAVLGGFLGVPLAAAQGSLECAATIGHQQAGTGTISVRKDDDVSISGVAKPNSVSSIFLSFAGLKKKIGEAVAGSDGHWSKTIDVKEYAKWGVGLYRVAWKSVAASAAGALERSATCTADVKVEGEFFGTRVSWIASAALAAGAAGLLLTLHSSLSIFRGNARWELKAHAKAKVERDEATGKVTVKVKGAVAQTLLSTLWGLLVGGAGFAALVGTAASPPTVTLALTITMPLAIAGFLLGELKRTAITQAVLRGLYVPPPPPGAAAAQAA